MRQLITRILTGAIFVCVTIFLIVLHEYSLLAFLLIVNTWLSIEFFKLMNLKKKFIISSLIISSLSILFVFFFLEYQLDAKYFSLFLPLIFINFIISLYEKTNLAIKNLAITILSFVYFTIPLILLSVLTLGNIVEYKSDFNPRLLPIVIFILIWTNDSFAYLTGCFVFRKKRHPLFERVSPKKSWEGSIGGAVITFLVAYLISRLLPFEIIDALALATITIVFGTFGDLIESLFKRHLGVKDSGKSLPGHGGLLDRLDSFIFTVPFVFLYLIVKQMIF